MVKVTMVQVNQQDMLDKRAMVKLVTHRHNMVNNLKLMVMIQVIGICSVIVIM